MYFLAIDKECFAHYTYTSIRQLVMPSDEYYTIGFWRMTSLRAHQAPHLLTRRRTGESSPRVSFYRLPSPLC